MIQQGPNHFKALSIFLIESVSNSSANVDVIIEFRDFQAAAKHTPNYANKLFVTSS